MGIFVNYSKIKRAQSTLAIWTLQFNFFIITFYLRINYNY